MAKEVQSYYDTIAKDYNESRFQNTYGQYIHEQEQRILEANLPKQGRILNLGCGTGRFMEFCTDGIDFSENMLQHAIDKFPNKQFQVSSGDKTPFEDNTFDAIICFHVIMHISPDERKSVFIEVHRILKPGGVFIVDYPSQNRRKLTRYKGNPESQHNWHGNSGVFYKEFKAEVSQHWNIRKQRGILFFPIHRIPRKIRRLFLPVDRFFSSGIFKKYSSYLVAILENKPYA